MNLKRLLTPLLVAGVLLFLGSSAFAQTNVHCGLSVPLGSTPRATATGHTEPIAAGPPVDVGGFKASPPTAGGGDVRVTCVNAGTAGSATDPGVVALTISLGTPVTNTTGGFPS